MHESQYTVLQHGVTVAVVSSRWHSGHSHRFKSSIVHRLPFSGGSYVRWKHVTSPYGRITTPLVGRRTNDLGNCSSP